MKRSVGMQTKWTFSSTRAQVFGAGSPSSRIVQASLIRPAAPSYTFVRPTSPSRLTSSLFPRVSSSTQEKCDSPLSLPFARERPSLPIQSTPARGALLQTTGNETKASSSLFTLRGPPTNWDVSPSSRSMVLNRENFYSSSPLHPKLQLPNWNVSPLPGIRRLSVVESPSAPTFTTKWSVIDSPGVSNKTQSTSEADLSFKPSKRKRPTRKRGRSSKGKAASPMNLSAHVGSTDVDDTASSTTDGSEESDDESDSPSPSDEWIKSHRNHTRETMMRYPRTYMGLDLDWADGLIQLLSYKIKRAENCSLNSKDMVMIVLRKLKLDESFEVIGHAFGVSKQYVSQIFKKYLPFISDHLYELVVWPKKESTTNALPVSFRKSFRDIESIIDCFEIEIEVPSSAFFQALTWSSYKHCNTIKYLVSITPNGIINFISLGYGGRISDELITTQSGYLDVLKSRAPVTVMADRGFKRIEKHLLEIDCKLVRPPSVDANVKQTQEQILFGRKVAGTRIHVERAIRRIREFKYLAPHACVDIFAVNTLDFAVRAVCGLVNMQSALIK